jgi:hypothetical protein
MGVGTLHAHRRNFAQCVAMRCPPDQLVGVSTKVSTTAASAALLDSHLFDCACIIFVVLTRGNLLPKQMLYQAELRPDPTGPGW